MTREKGSSWLGFWIGVGLAVLIWATSQPSEASTPANITNTVGVCDPNYPQRCIAPAADGSIAVTGTITPSGTQAVNVTQIGGNAVTTTIPVSDAGGSLTVDGTVALGAGAATVGAISNTTFAATQSGTWTVLAGGNSFTNITTNTDTVVKASAGTFAGIVINSIGTTSTATVYNNTTCTGAKIATFSTLVQASLEINATASVGICVTTAGAVAADITILWR